MYAGVKCQPLAGSVWKWLIAKNVNQSIHSVAKMYGSTDRSSDHGKIVSNNEFLSTWERDVAP